jgi:hypothetical protein
MRYVSTLSAGVLAVLAFAPLGFAQADQADVITHHVEQVATPGDVLVGMMMAEPTVASDLEDGVDIGTIVNLGKEIWAIIVENQPVVNTSHDYANALPRGVTSAGDLDGFSDLTTTSYRMWGENGFGMTVYDVTYTLVHQYGGSYDGKGKFLATASVLPASISVLWGYNVDLHVKHVSSLNVGSATAPVGSVNMELAFTVHTVIKHHTTTTLYQFRGDSSTVKSTDL